MTSFKVAVLGHWHLAFTSSAVLSHVGHSVVLVNPEFKASGAPASDRDLQFQDFPKPPVTEPGLPEMIRACQAEGRLAYTMSLEGWKAEAVWLAIDTPVNDLDEPDVAPLVSALKKYVHAHPETKILIVSSQIPIGFARGLQKQFGLPVAVVPENLRLGKGIDTFLNADRTIVGADSESSLHYVKELLKGFKTEFLLCGLETAEMTKHANNAFLATSISFANELARIGEQYGVESQIVAKALKLDKRIGPAAYVAPGLGFAGGTLPRDLRVLQKKGKETSIPTPLLDAVLKVNEETTTAIAEIVLSSVRELTENLKRAAQVLVLGYTYKADTDTLRRSLSIDIARILKNKNCQVWGMDPVMNSHDLGQLDGLIHHCPQVEDLKVQPDVVLVMTARPVFKTFPWRKVAKPDGSTLVVDTQNWISQAEVLDAGLKFKPLWSPLVSRQ